MKSPAPHAACRFHMAEAQGGRSEQQDAGVYLHNEAQGTALVVVGDGVGGRSGGRMAAQKVTQLASELWEERKGHLASPAEDLAMLCQVAHEHINSEGAKLGLSPRTTIVALYLTKTSAFWIHSGDSRLYHFRNGQLLARTEDHSLLELMVQRGAVKEEDMGSHPDQNTLLQSLGGSEFSAPSAGTAAITPDDAFLLCTDGFWERMKQEELAELTLASRTEAAERLAQAVAQAVERNGRKSDNVTAVLALPAREKPALIVRPPLNRVLLIGAVLLLLLVAAILFLWPDGKKDPAPAAADEPEVRVAVPVDRAAPPRKDAGNYPARTPRDLKIKDDALNDRSAPVK